jgi:cell division transport system permease protein
MNWENFSRIIKLGLTNFWRNRWLSFASTLIMSLTLLVISIFVILTLVIGKTTDSIKSKMDISVYFNDSANMEQIVNLQQKVAGRTDVREVVYVSKEEALAIFRNQQQGKRVSEYIKPEENPLPRSLEIKAQAAESLKDIAQYLDQAEFKNIVQNISYQENKKIIERLIAITSFVKELGLLLSLTFVIISVLVVFNTIRLTIFSRKDEIEIMRLVGASDIFVKVPFIVEGLLYGILATFISSGLLWAGVVVIAPRIEQYLGSSVSSRMTSFFYDHFLIIISLELLVGSTISIVCSLISIRKHLRV